MKEKNLVYVFGNVSPSGRYYIPSQSAGYSIWEVSLTKKGMTETATDWNIYKENIPTEAISKKEFYLKYI